MKVSVIMSVYRRVEYLEEAINSVLEQTFSNIELIIVNSQDNIESLDEVGIKLKSCYSKDERIKLFILGYQNISESWNAAIRFSTGDFIAVMGSDDLWEKDKIEKQIKILNLFPDKIIWTEGKVINKKGEYTGYFFSEIYSSGINIGKVCSNYRDRLMMGNFIPSQSLMFNINIAKHIWFDENLPLYSDYKFLLDASETYDFFHMDEKLFSYRLHNSNVTNNGSKQWLSELVSIEKIKLEMIKSKGSKEANFIKAFINTKLAIHYLREKNIKEFVKNFKMAIRLNIVSFILYIAFNIPYTITRLKIIQRIIREE